MKYLLVFLLALTLALIGKSLLGITLIFAFVASVALQLETKESLIIAFGSGIAASVINNSILGRESLGLLVSAGLIQVFKQRVTKYWIFMVMIVILASVMNRMILGKELLLKDVLADGILTLVLTVLAKEIRRKLFSDQIVVKI